MPGKKRILVVCQHFWPEPIFRITDICSGLVEQDYEVDVLCGIPNYPEGHFYEGYGFFKNRRQVYKGINIIRAPEIPRGTNTNFRILINFFSFPLFALFYTPLFLRRKYDRVLVYQLSPVFMALPAIIIAKLKRVKLYIYILDFWPHSLFSVIYFKNRFIRKLITAMSYWHYRRADGLIGVFKGIQRKLISEVKISPQKTIYITQSAEKIFEKDVHDKELEKRFGNKFNLVFAGSINPAQSFSTVVDAAKKVIDSGIKDINFIIVGDGMSRSKVESDVQRLGLDDYFHFEGFKPTSDVPKYQSLADALLVALTKSPLFEYGIPAKIQAYMAAGKPIIGAMNGEGQALIKRSNSGLCVDSGDSDGLARAIIKLVKMDKVKRDFMGKNAREYHFKYFERNKNLNRLIEFVFNDKLIPDEEYRTIK